MQTLMWNRRYWIPDNYFTCDDWRNMLLSVGFTLLKSVEHDFDPVGHSVLFLLAESHFAIHTFPEHSVEYIELTSCNKELMLAFHEALVRSAEERDCKVNNIPFLPVTSQGFIDEDDGLVFESLGEGNYWVGTYTRKVAHLKTPYQEFAILDGPRGRSLYIDGYLQSRQPTEFIYHEMLVHPAMMGVERAKRALVLGGGEGAVLRELLRYHEVAQVVMVDIDEALVDACKQHLTDWHRGAFNDSRVQLVIGDGLNFVRNCDEEFDLVVLDLPSLTSKNSDNLCAISKSFLTRRFYSDLSRILTDKGVIVSYFGDFFDSPESRWNVREVAKEVFSHFWLYRVNGILLKMFIIAQRDISIYSINDECADLARIANEINQGIRQRVDGVLRYYNGFEHVASFALSNDMLQWID